MAINSGRYVVTGGYMNPDGQIVEERQYIPGDANTPSVEYVPSTTGTTFSPEDVYRMQAEGYYNMGDKNIGDAYSALWKGSDAYSSTAKQMNDFYNQLYGDTVNLETGLGQAKYTLNKQLTDDIAKTRDYVMSTFGPQGSLTKEINKYYDDLGNYLQTDAGRQAATIAAQGVHSGASLGAIRAQQNEAYNESFGRYIQAKEQELDAKQKIAQNLISYMSTLRQEYGNTTNQYIIQQYERAANLLEGLQNNMANQNIELRMAKLNNALRGSGGGDGTQDSSLLTFNILRNGAREYFNAMGGNFDELSAEQQNMVINNYYNALVSKDTEVSTTEEEKGSDGIVTN